MSDPPPLCLRLLGPPALGPAGGPLHPLERKDAALLARLALAGVQGRDELALLLWPDAAPRTAAGSLRQRIFRLRRRHGHDLVQAGERVLLLPAVQPDVQADRPPGLADSAGLVDEPILLAGCEYGDCPELAAWVDLQRQRRRVQRREAMALRASAHESRGELAAALDLAQRLAAEEPLSEHAVRRVMRLHYLRGDRAAALVAFEQCERTVKDELGARPGAETLALLAMIEGARPAVSAAPRAPVPASLQRPPRLVGRRRELEALAQAWAKGQVFLLLGEAGMGKSRLLADWVAYWPGSLPAVPTAAAIAPASRCLHVPARPGDADVPYALLVRLLRAVFEQVRPPQDPLIRSELARVLPEWAATRPAGEAQRLVLQQAVEDALAGSAELGALLLDDLHFADSASLELLQGLVAGERLNALNWGLAQRPGEGGRAAQTLRDALVETQRLCEVVLSPLDVQAMSELVSSLGLPELDGKALAAPLVRHTGGNPLFALETLKDLVVRGTPAATPAGAAGIGPAGSMLPQPASVSTLIERRLRMLAPDALALARVVAIAGSDFDIEMAEAVLQRPALSLADAWAELQSAQVLAGSALAHDLVFEAVLRSVPGEIARRVHGAVASVLAARNGEPARVGAHWEAAARWPEAAASLGSAAVAARQAGRMGDALALARRAAAAHAAAGHAQARWQTECDTIELVTTVEGPPAAIQLADRLLDEATEPTQRVDALVGAALAHAVGGHPDAVLAASEAALALREAAPSSPRLFDARRLRSHALALLNRVPEAVAELQAMQPAVDAAGSLRQRYEHRSSLAYALNRCGQPLACNAALRETIELAQAAGDIAEVMSSLSNLAVSEFNGGYAAAALEHALAARALRERVGAPAGPHMLINDMNTAAMALLVGRFDLALPALEEAPQRLQAVGEVWAGTASNHLALLWIHLGQPHRAQRVLDSGAGGTLPLVARRRVLLQARLVRARGHARNQAIAQQLEQVATDLRQGPSVRDAASVDLELSRIVEQPRALELVRRVQRDCAPAGLAGFVLHARVREIELLLGTDPAVAATLASSLEDEATGLVLTDGYLPELWLVAARAALAGGDDARALRRLQRGWQWAQEAAARLPAGLRGAFAEGNGVNLALRRELAALGTRSG